MRNVLIRPHDNHASCLAIDAAHCKDVITALMSAQNIYS
jgi:hypothetical protein